MNTVQAEDVVLMAAVGADEGAHILHHSENGDIDLPEEINAAHGIPESEVLRGGDNDGAYIPSVCRLQ